LMCSSINDQQIFIISHGETISRSCWTPFVVEARIEPSTFRPVSPTLYLLSYPAHHSLGCIFILKNAFRWRCREQQPEARVGGIH
jgi:hypothetical protein